MLADTDRRGDLYISTYSTWPGVSGGRRRVSVAWCVLTWTIHDIRLLPFHYIILQPLRNKCDCSLPPQSPENPAIAEAVLSSFMPATDAFTGHHPPQTKLSANPMMATTSSGEPKKLHDLRMPLCPRTFPPIPNNLPPASDILYLIFPYLSPAEFLSFTSCTVSQPLPRPVFPFQTLRSYPPRPPSHHPH